MLSAIENVEEFTQGVTLEGFMHSKILFFAVVKNIEIVGEATYMLTKAFKESHSTIPRSLRRCVMFWFMVIIP